MIDLVGWFAHYHGRYYERSPKLARLLWPAMVLILSGLIVWPGALLSMAEVDDKRWVAWISMLVIFVSLLCVGYEVLMPVHTPRRPEVHVFIPANDIDIIGDALLQYAGFLAANANTEYRNCIDLRFHDSSKEGWLAELEECIEKTPSQYPVWIIITMSAKGEDARARLNVLLEKSHRLGKQLTVLFTVASSSFRTSDRNNYFRLFVDGRDEAIAIASYIHLTHSKSTNKRVLCVRNNSHYGKDAAKELDARLKDVFTVDVRTVDDLVNVKSTDYEIAVVIAYDEELPEFFNKLNADGFAGLAIGTTTLSVPDWQERISFDTDAIQVFHTAVHHDDDEDFRGRLQRIDVDSIARLNEECLINQDTLQQLHKHVDRYKAYQNIRHNYISAFCEDCIRLFVLVSKAGKPSLRALLDDPKYDKERRKSIIRDVDFGVTGDAHVSVFLKRLERDRPRPSGDSVSDAVSTLS